MLETKKEISYAVETTPIQKLINFLYVDGFSEKNYYLLLKILCYWEDCSFGILKEFLENENLWINFWKQSWLPKTKVEEIKKEIILESIRKYLTKKVQGICNQ